MLIELEDVIYERAQEYVPLVYLSNPLAGVSPYVDTHFPEFVREDHQKFIDFIRTYYQWLEGESNVLSDAKKLIDYQDIDHTKEPYREQFFREFLVNIPRKLKISPDLFLKHVKNFYRSRGTEKSFRTFFRAIYGIDCEFYYPREDILKVSDGKWIQEKSIKVFSISGNPYNLKSKRIRGRSSNSSAFVEKIYPVREGIFSGFKLVLNRSSITGDFLAEEIVESEDLSINCRISAIPKTITIVEPGQDYQVGQKFNIEDGIGKGAVVEVQTVGTSGEILSLNILKYGIGYQSSIPTLDYSLEAQGIPVFARINIDYGALITYAGYYLNEDGQLSTLKYIHDGDFYQAFSYVTYVNESLSEYRELLKKILHPAGFKLFGGFRSVNLLDAKLSISTAQIKRISYSSDASVANAGIRSAKTEIYVEDVSTSSLGPNYESIYRQRFNYKPFYKYDANSEFYTISNYFGVSDDLSAQKSITPIKVFDELNIKPIDIDNNFNGRTKLSPDAVILTEEKVSISVP